MNISLLRLYESGDKWIRYIVPPCYCICKLYYARDSESAMSTYSGPICRAIIFWGAPCERSTSRRRSPRKVGLALSRLMVIVGQHIHCRSIATIPLSKQQSHRKYKYTDLRRYQNKAGSAWSRMSAHTVWSAAEPSPDPSPVSVPYWSPCGTETVFSTYIHNRTFRLNNRIIYWNILSKHVCMCIYVRNIWHCNIAPLHQLGICHNVCMYVCMVCMYVCMWWS